MAQVVICPRCGGKATNYQAQVEGSQVTIYQCSGNCTQTVLYPENYQIVFEFIFQDNTAIPVYPSPDEYS